MNNYTVWVFDDSYELVEIEITTDTVEQVRVDTLKINGAVIKFEHDIFAWQQE
jgi:hypothetical protein